jgi:hypothetical protein
MVLQRATHPIQKQLINVAPPLQSLGVPKDLQK